MKKSLEHIFDEAKASEIERLVDQNAAPDVSADTLASIKNKVYAKTGIAKMKKKKPLIFCWQSYAAAAACLCLTMGVMLGSAYAAEVGYDEERLFIERILTNNRQPGWNIVDPSTENPFPWDVDLNKSPDELLKDFEGKDVVIQKDDAVIQGKSLWDDFYTKTQNGQSAEIKIIHYSTHQEPQALFLGVISFDGEFYKQDIVQALNPDYRDIRLFEYLLKFEGVYDYSDTPYKYEDYVLILVDRLPSYSPEWRVEGYYDSWSGRAFACSMPWSNYNDFSVVCKFR